MASENSVSVDSQGNRETHVVHAVDRKGGGHRSHEAQKAFAAPTNSVSVDNPSRRETHMAHAVDREGGGPDDSEIHPLFAAPAKTIRRRRNQAEAPIVCAAADGGGGLIEREALRRSAAPATNSSLIDGHQLIETHQGGAVDRDGGDRHYGAEAHLSVAIPVTNSISFDGQGCIEAQGTDAVVRDGGDRQKKAETQGVRAIPAGDIVEIVMQWRRRRQWHGAEKKLTLQCAAICRGWCDGDKKLAGQMLARIEGGRAEEDDSGAAVTVHALLEARDRIKPHRLVVEKTLKKLARGLPVWDAWGAGQLGFGELSLAAIIGEAGDLSNYATVSRLWKRMGLAVINGERQRKVLSKEDAILHGYNPERRSVVWNIGECLIKAQKEGHPWRNIYLREKEKQLANEHPPWLADKRAKRYMTKRFLASLWGAWNGRGGHSSFETHDTHAAPADKSGGVQ